MIKRFGCLGLLLILAACSNNKATFKVAATPVPHAEMLEFIKPDLQAQGMEMEILVTEDYNLPNRALAAGEVEANFFQHIPFLDEQIKQFGYPIESLAKIEIEPMGLYSKKIKALSDIKEGARIAVPNDPTNEARALLLLQEAGLIAIKDPLNFQSTTANIIENPKKIKWVEVDAAMLPRTLDEVDAAVINANFALGAGLNPEKDALARESAASPYANIIAIRKGDEEKPEVAALKVAMTSEKMREFILSRYKGAILPAF